MPSSSALCSSMHLQLDAPANRCTCSSMHLQLDAPAARCTCNSMHLQLDAPTTRCTCSSMHLQLDAPATRCTAKHNIQERQTPLIAVSSDRMELTWWRVSRVWPGTITVVSCCRPSLIGRQECQPTSRFQRPISQVPGAINK